MQLHIKNFIDYYWEDFRTCMVCWKQWIEVHHIIYRSHFSKKDKHLQDNISNLLFCCRSCHEKAHRNILTKEFLQWIVKEKMKK